MENVVYSCTLSYGTYSSFGSVYSFCIMYTTYHIFLVLPIKDLLNKDGDPTTPHKLATGFETFSITFTRYLLSISYTEIYLRRLDNGVQYASPSTKCFLRYICWYSRASKKISCVHTQYMEDIMLI